MEFRWKISALFILSGQFWFVLATGPGYRPYSPPVYYPAPDKTESRVEYAMKSAGIIPDVLPNAPKQYVLVEYYGRFPVLLGNKLTPPQVKDKPFIHYDADKDALYTVAMVDPDAPSRQHPNISEVLHFLVGNVPGNNIHAGDMRAEYLGAAPPPGTGPHRYVFFVFKQPKMITFEEEKITSSDEDRTKRWNFKIKDFAEKYEFGDPVAGNFFYSSFEYYVGAPWRPIYYKPRKYNRYWW